MTHVTKTADGRMVDEMKFIQDGEEQHNKTATSFNLPARSTSSVEPVASTLAGVINVAGTN
jgi:hypothetical protein